MRREPRRGWPPVASRAALRTADATGAARCVVRTERTELALGGGRRTVPRKRQGTGANRDASSTGSSSVLRRRRCGARSVQRCEGALLHCTRRATSPSPTALLFFMTRTANKMALGQQQQQRHGAPRRLESPHRRRGSAENECATTSCNGEHSDGANT